MAERPEDLNLPNSVIARIIKDSLPEGVIVSKDARLAVSKAASVFVLYATSCANNFAMNHKRRTITPQDVLESMTEMEFEKYIDVLKESLNAYKEEQKQRKASNQQKKKETDNNVPNKNNEEDESKDGEAEVVISDDENDTVDAEASTTHVINGGENQDMDEDH